MAVAAMMVLGLAASLSARPTFPGVGGDWVLKGSVEYHIRVHGYRDRCDAYLPPVAASFEPTGDFSMEWADAVGMTDVRVTGWYEQRRQRVRSDALVAPYFERALRRMIAEAGVSVSSFTPDSLRLDLVVLGDWNLAGTVRVEFCVVTASGRKGWAVATMEFQGVRSGSYQEPGSDD